MRIGIDARFLTHPQRGGFKTYTENLVMALPQVDPTNEYILYLDRPPQEQTRLPKWPNVSHQIVPGQVPVIGMPWREHVGLARRASIDDLDLLHSPCLTAPFRLSCARVVTIHDMIWHRAEHSAESRGAFSLRTLMQWYYRLAPLHAARNAAVILTVSQASKDRIVESLRVLPARVIVTHEAASRMFRRIEEARFIEAALKRYGLPASFILGIGSADPRKNVATLLRAYASMPPILRETHQLVIILTHSSMAIDLTRHAHTLGLSGRVRFLEKVPDEDLVVMYNAASLFVFPSLQEGFGLPLLEAMACGAPVIAADNSSIPEIAGDAAILVEARDDQAIASAMIGVLTDTSIQETLRAKGLERAASFSWETCARQTILAYELALQNHASRKSTAY